MEGKGTKDRNGAAYFYPALLQRWPELGTFSILSDVSTETEL